MSRYRASLKSAMQQSQTTYLEILELTEAAGSVNEGFFGELIHPNHMGHRLMASELLKLMTLASHARRLTCTMSHLPNLFHTVNS